MAFQNKWTRYLFAILCFVPFIGAFVGIALIFYSVFNHRDKMLLTAGFIGIALTAAVYSILFYQLKYGKDASTGFAAISQSELNILVNQVEYFKYRTGSYPDSLEQLRLLDQSVNIYDPLLIRKMEDKSKMRFSYRKIGEKYMLFSVGPDGVPYTSDDIYPAILAQDSNKVGLLKRQ
jgi:hypothetical protein